MSLIGWSGKVFISPVKSTLIGERVSDRIEQGECVFQNVVKNLTPKWSECLVGNREERSAEKTKWQTVVEEYTKQIKLFLSDHTLDDPKPLQLMRMGHRTTLRHFAKLSEKYSKPKFKVENAIKKSKYAKKRWAKLPVGYIKLVEPLRNIRVTASKVWVTEGKAVQRYVPCASKLLGESLRFNPLKISQHCYHPNGGNGRNPDPARELPKLLYIQNPIVWASNKLDFRYLRTSWDPQFTEHDFTKGARQAVSRITQLVSKNMFDALKPLLTKNAMLNLRRDVEILWADEVRRNIGLEPEDVQLIIPRKLHFRSNGEKKFCDIDVVFIGLKFLETRNQNPPLAFIDIIARFHRNYTEGTTPDWTISAFKVRRFNILPPK
ncbi:uncharacterized protein LOC106662888 [Cimex lectularius]|uniref:Uncharacterized protein n=1 Tax=Cimex lectularius TaxID=79782 RepID=A0A8I6RB97_CIMLE|nr:uncharacterized protein LOC106662888 [Cimex lectularius]